MRLPSNENGWHRLNKISHTSELMSLATVYYYNHRKKWNNKWKLKYKNFLNYNSKKKIPNLLRPLFKMWLHDYVSAYSSVLGSLWQLFFYFCNLFLPSAVLGYIWLLYHIWWLKWKQCGLFTVQQTSCFTFWDVHQGILPQSPCSTFRCWASRPPVCSHPSI